MVNRLLLCLLLLSALAISRASAQPCVEVVQKPVNVGQVLVGGYVDSAVFLRVNSPNGGIFELLPTGDSSVTFDLSFPRRLDSGIHRLAFRYHSDLLGQQGFGFVIRDTLNQQTCFDTIRVVATGIDTTALGTVFQLSSPNNVMAVSSEKDRDTFRVFIRNNTNAERVIEAFRMDAGAFKIEDVPVVPLILDPGASFNFDIYFSPPAPGFYQSVIHLPNDGGLASEYIIRVQGLSLREASVPPIKAPSGIIVRQSATQLAIEGIPYDLGSIEIFDVLGRKLMQVEHQTRELMIDKRVSGEHLQGAYILRFVASDGSRSESVKVILASY